MIALFVARNHIMRRAVRVANMSTDAVNENHEAVVGAALVDALDRYHAIRAAAQRMLDADNSAMAICRLYDRMNLKGIQ